MLLCSSTLHPLPWWCTFATHTWPSDAFSDIRGYHALLRPYIWIQATLGHSQEYLRTRHRSDSWCNILTGWARFHCFHFMSIYKVCFLAVYSSVFKLLTAGPGIQCISDSELFLPILSLHSGTILLCFRAQDIRCGALRCCFDFGCTIHHISWIFMMWQCQVSVSSGTSGSIYWLALQQFECIIVETI